jgi:hypothetical protein
LLSLKHHRIYPHFIFFDRATISTHTPSFRLHLLSNTTASIHHPPSPTKSPHPNTTRPPKISSTSSNNNPNNRTAGYIFAEMLAYLTGESHTPPGPLPPRYPVPGSWVDPNATPEPAKKTFTLDPEAEAFAPKKESEGEKVPEEKEGKKG